jgi:multisubunit Na+/H+ antiporter MnhE subunit
MLQAVREHVGAWVISCAVFAVLWLLFVAKLERLEIAAGVIASAVAATAVVAVEHQRLASFHPKFYWLLQVWRLPWYAISGTAVLAYVLFARIILRKDIQPVIKAVPFDAGASDPQSAARRALAIAYTTFAPNFVILGIDLGRNLMLVHQVMSSDVPGVVKVLRNAVDPERS